jgi:hypothetical protein
LVAFPKTARFPAKKRKTGVSGTERWIRLRPGIDRGANNMTRQAGRKTYGTVSLEQRKEMTVAWETKKTK